MQLQNGINFWLLCEDSLVCEVGLYYAHSRGV
jgi:hypothetical protein